MNRFIRLLESLGNKRYNCLFLEYVDLQNLQESVQRALNAEPFFRDGHEKVNAQPDPYLALHCVYGSAIKRLDPQVLLDPLEKKFHSPALFVNVGNRFCRDVKIVREKHQMFLSFFVNITDSAQPLR